MKASSRRELRILLMRAYEKSKSLSNRKASNKIKGILKENRSLVPGKFAPLVSTYLDYGEGTNPYRKSDQFTKDLLDWQVSMKLSVPCESCGNHIVGKDIYRRTEHRFCSTKCSNASADVKNKVKDTFKKYEGGHPQRCQAVLEKRQATCLKRYGETNVSKSESVKDRIKHTWMEKYGADSPFKDPEVANKREQTWEKEYGGHPWASTSVQDSIRRTMEDRYGNENPQRCKKLRAKTKKTNLARYGNTCALASPEVLAKTKKTWLVRYGVEHPMQNREIFHKNQMSSYKTKTIQLRGKTFSGLQGYEPQAIRRLVKVLRVPVNRIKCGEAVTGEFWYSAGGKKHRYYPDLKVGNTYIEVKSEYTAKGKDVYRKLKAVVKAGYLARLWVLDKAGNLLREQRF